jgi:hypothetical protein
LGKEFRRNLESFEEGEQGFEEFERNFDEIMMVSRVRTNVVDSYEVIVGNSFSFKMKFAGKKISKIL